jgi:hypothetical protein
MDNAFALVVGISAYENLFPLPPTVVNDAHEIYAVLTDAQRCGYAQEHVEILLDGKATLAGIRQALGVLARRCDQDSTALIYFSGHGARIAASPHAGEYLLAVDTRYSSDEILAQTAISGAEFSEALRAIPARKVVVIFDCCHAGGIGQPKDARAVKTLPESFYQELAAGRGRVILASSRSTELSYVRDDAANSVFTEHLLAGLSGGVTSEDGLIRIFDLFEYLQPRVTADWHDQHPIFKAEIEENFAVARYLGGQKGVVPRDEDGFRYDAYISYVDREPDATWVWDTLLPHLQKAGLRVAISGDVEEPGVARVVNIERGIRKAKRTVIVLSDAYLTDSLAEFENILAQDKSIQEGTYRLLPVKITPVAESLLPVRLSMLATLDLTDPRRAERNMDRLVQALQSRLPQR